MSRMKYPNIGGGTNMAVSANNAAHDEVDSLFTSPCWQTSTLSLQNDFIDTHSLALDSSMSHLGADKLLLDGQDDDIETDALDKLFLSSPPTSSLAELKPLPPFTGYTANLSINGIPGHHYHTISQRIPEENNNNYSAYNEQNIVSSSTCNPDADCKAMYVDDVAAKLGYADSVSGTKMYDHHVKNEMGDYDISIDFANIIGSAIADTTVPSTNPDSEDPAGSRDSWMDLDALIDGACNDQQKSSVVSQYEFVIPASEYQKQHQSLQNSGGGSTLQTLLTHGYMPLLHNRLQNGPPIKQEAPSSSSYGSELISTSSPPGNVVSTTDSLMMNGRFMSHQYGVVEQEHRVRSPDLLGQNYPHTTTTSTPGASKKARNRAAKKTQAAAAAQQASSTVFQSEQALGLLGKEKPVHRCSICNRGFLNKSNIKVHLRTHTGEKPFRCDTCAKAFRQKAHLLKHQQIHKRIGRD